MKENTREEKWSRGEHGPGKYVPVTVVGKVKTTGEGRKTIYLRKIPIIVLITKLALVLCLDLVPFWCIASRSETIGNFLPNFLISSQFRNDKFFSKNF